MTITDVCNPVLPINRVLMLSVNWSDKLVNFYFSYDFVRQSDKSNSLMTLQTLVNVLSRKERGRKL